MSPGTAAAAGTKRTARVAPVSGLVRSLAAAQSSAQYIWRCPSAAHQDLAELCRSGVGAVQVFQTSRLILERLRAASPFEMHTRSWPVSFVFIRK